ncbi:MAG: osmotically inducible protein OsmC [Candidatus Aminicenantes bacterium]|nr:MAG: osmotically inducible protein OsmC [Candidatus Aminicenantes bacterium]
MPPEMRIIFNGDQKVIAEYKGFRIETDQPIYAGGQGSAPAPFDLFLASIGTCAGYYVFAFCRQRNLPLEDVYVTLKTIINREAKRIDKIVIEVHLPEGFPDKYNQAILKAIDQCAVKKHIVESPEFELKTVKD